MKVAFYTSVHFIDAAIETIRSVKEKVALHVFIEITSNSKKTTIVDVEDLRHCNLLEKPEVVLGEQQWQLFKPHFQGVASVQFVVQQHPKSFSFRSVIDSFKVGSYLRKQHFDCIHFDNISTRLLGLYPALGKTKVVVTLHDPVAHSGEHDKKAAFVSKLFVKRANAFVFCSEFATQLFKQQFPGIDKPIHTIHLQPYTFIRHYCSGNVAQQTILFFGRLSYYKGIDLLLKAIPNVLKQFPHQQFLIAGKPNPDFTIDQEIIDAYPNNIKIVSRHLSTPEMIQMIESSKFVVCPYRDATQSGVLMTCFAVGRTALVTQVGSFAEFVKEGVNGLLCAPESESLSEKMIQMLASEQFLQYQKNVEIQSPEKKSDAIGRILLNAYEIKY